jgi:hypothetical protein
MKKILLFEEYLTQYFGEALNEASMEDLGFAALLGSTDKQNLGDAAANIGIEKNMSYTITIKSIKDMVDLGTKKSYEGFSRVAKGSAVPDKSDFIQITSKGQTKEIPQKIGSSGNIILDFDNSGIQISASNNGLLAFMRACTSAAQVFGKGGVDPQKVNGKLLISMGNPIANDSSRNAAFLAVSTDISGANKFRTSSEFFTKFWLPKIESDSKKFTKYIKEDLDVIKESESMKDASSLINLIGDSLADSIRAASWQYEKARSFYSNDSNCYKAFREIYRELKKKASDEGKDTKGKNKDLSTIVLAMMMQKIIRKLGEAYPFNNKDFDMIPTAKEILKQVGTPQSTVLKPEPLEKLIAEFSPNSYPKISQFDPVLPEFWESITSAVVLRTASTFSKNVSDPGQEEFEGEKKEMKGGEKSGAKQNVSGGA